jgi:hypothetical protein
MIYAGIGSVDTPLPILRRMMRLGALHALRGNTLRSGGAKGADTAFEKGCDRALGSKEIFYSQDSTAEALLMAEQFKTGWDNFGSYIQGLFARNCMIILGRDLKTPVDLVICWTPDGMPVGGTGHSIRVALSRGIPVINLGAPRVTKESLEFYHV